jgi:DNA polymerase-3 subunit epsilon
MECLSQVWSDLPYIVLDTETTGLSSADRVCEVTVALCRDGKITHEVSSLVNPGIPIPESATAIHGITDSCVQDSPRLKDLLPSILDLLCLDLPWVAHHMAFDFRMLTYDIDRSVLPRGVPTLCTLEYSRRRHPDLRRHAKHRLSDVADFFGLEHGQLHRSRGDVELLSRIVPRLVGKHTVAEAMTRWSQDW